MKHVKHPRHVCFTFLALILLLASSANAISFSFASDDNHDGPTFHGQTTGSDLVQASMLDDNGKVIVDLVIDVNDDAPGGILCFQAILTFSGDLRNYTVTARGGAHVHQWDVEGSATLTHTGTGDQLLQINFNDALLTSWSPSSTTLGQTATLQDSEGVDSSLGFVPGPPLQGLGMDSAALSSKEDFAFTMTRIEGENGLPAINATTGKITNIWVAEGSFSAFAMPSN